MPPLMLQTLYTKCWFKFGAKRIKGVGCMEYGGIVRNINRTKHTQRAKPQQHDGAKKLSYHLGALALCPEQTK